MKDSLCLLPAQVWCIVKPIDHILQENKQKNIGNELVDLTTKTLIFEFWYICLNNVPYVY